MFATKHRERNEIDVTAAMQHLIVASQASPTVFSISLALLRKAPVFGVQSLIALTPIAINGLNGCFWPFFACVRLGLALQLIIIVHTLLLR